MVGGYRETIVGCKDDDCWLQRRRLVVAEKTIGGCRGDDGGCREDGCWLQRLRLVDAENTIGGCREDDWWRKKKIPVLKEIKSIVLSTCLLPLRKLPAWPASWTQGYFRFR